MAPLKAKRILYQRQGRAVCLPTGNLLDKPIGDKIFGRETLAWFAASLSRGPAFALNKSRPTRRV